jgi:hypothetical protein
MRTTLSIFAAGITALTLAFSPVIVSAATPAADPNCPAGSPPELHCPSSAALANGASDVVTLVKTITNWLFTFLLLLAVMFFIIAGYKYLTSGGGEEVGSAHKMVMYGAVAVAVGTLAQGIVYVVQKLVG